MPTPTIPAGNLFMNATLYTGTNATQVITNGAPGASFQPDMVWIKSRSAAYNHGVIDSVRGVRPMIFPNLTNAEASTAVGTGLTSFNSNGFTLGTESTTSAPTNENGTTFVAWQWKAGGTAVTNTAGTITSSVSANTTSGFSVVTYTGNGSSGATVGHGLGVAPQFVIVKSRGAEAWPVWHTSLAGSTSYLRLNATDAVTTAANWMTALPSSTVCTFGNGGFDNTNAVNYVMYCWTPIAGYSAFGSYTGNGSTNGPFIYTGFRPRFVMTKKSSGTGAWAIVDTSIIPYNQETTYLQPNTSGAVVGGTSSNGMDINSNGFKIRSTDASFNETNGDTYIYACWAENPFKYSNAR